MDISQLDESKVYDLPLTEILADDEFNCRGPILAVNVVELAKSIADKGLLQPITVAPLRDDLKAGHPDKKYRLVAGFRRFKAHEVLSLGKIRALIRVKMMDEKEARFFNLEENINRVDLDIMQEARALEEFKKLRVPREEVAERLNKSGAWVQTRYYLLDLPKEIQQEAALRTITQQQIKEIHAIMTTVTRGTGGNKDAGIKAAFEATKRAKEAKAKGKAQAAQININKVKPTAKHHRNRAELFDMIDVIMDSLGGGLHTRALSWAAGEISTLDFYSDLRTEAIRLGKVFVPPRNLFQEQEEMIKEFTENATEERVEQENDSAEHTETNS